MSKSLERFSKFLMPKMYVALIFYEELRLNQAAGITCRLKYLYSYAGLNVKIIRGVSKSVGYRPGMPLQDGRFRNSWAAVHIEGEWRFVDSHWGARHVINSRMSGELLSSGGFCYELDEFFFLTGEVINMHS